MKKVDIKSLHVGGRTVFVFCSELMTSMMCAKLGDGQYISVESTVDVIKAYAKASLYALPVDHYFKAVAGVIIDRYFIQEDKLYAIDKYAHEWMEKENAFQISIGNSPIY